MADLGLDAVVATAPENVTYTSGFWALPQWIRRGPQVYALWPAYGTGSPEIITSTATLDLVADQEPWIKSVRRYGDFQIDRHADAASDPVSCRQLQLHDLPDHGDAINALATALQEAGFARGRIGIDEIGLLPGHFDQLKDRLPNAILVPAAALFRHVRAVKTAEEVLRLGSVARITERSIDAALAVASEGAMELDLACAFHTRTMQEDAFPVLGCIGFGERSALINVPSSERGSAAATSFVSTSAAATPLPRRHRPYRDPGRAAAEVRRTMKRCSPASGMPAKSFGLGYARQTFSRKRWQPCAGGNCRTTGATTSAMASALTDTKRPIFPQPARRSSEGMVLCVETPYYELGAAGLQVEDMLVVRRDGVERLVATDGDLMVVPS